MPKPFLLFAASEVYPFAKSGGLADVAHSLPRALKDSYEVDVVLPLYKSIQREQFGIIASGDPFEVRIGSHVFTIEMYGCEYEGINYRFVYAPLLCEREYLYGPPECGYEDNALRFGLFNYAIVALLKRDRYQIAHLNDWQSGLVPLLLDIEKKVTTKTLFTIHNLAYQGTFESSILEEIGIPRRYFTMEGVEFYGQMSFMKAGIAFSDRVTTVSPNYAVEILTSEFGCGLEGFLNHHKDKLSGIVNGIDLEHFSPSQDNALYLPYVDLEGKRANKKAYLKEVGLKGEDKPLFIFVGRFTWQKGMELLTQALAELAVFECNIAVLGEGEEQYYDALKSLETEHDNVHLHFGYDESLSHRMYAAGDFLLMPSLFEPCGLNQMIAMHYGQMPVVHSVGGLADTVLHYRDFDPKSAKGYGVSFDAAEVSSFMTALKEALSVYADQKRYRVIIGHNMSRDFSWKASAQTYVKLYEEIL